ncbi:MAG: hypothetical protein K0S65_1066 [Labilithrix sp.]|nr:hypothetical protein [Labilithrix sp.]
MVRVDAASFVSCGSSDEDDDDVEVAPHRRAPVEYVRLSDWQPPPSAECAASEVTPRGDGAPTYTEFPKLTLHKPIPETTISGRFRYR